MPGKITVPAAPATIFANTTTTSAGPSAMTMPITMVDPSIMTTSVPLPPDFGIGTITAGTAITKKKQTTKKRTTNSNTAK